MFPCISISESHAFINLIFYILLGEIFIGIKENLAA